MMKTEKRLYMSWIICLLLVEVCLIQSTKVVPNAEDIDTPAPDAGAKNTPSPNAGDTKTPATKAGDNTTPAPKAGDNNTPASNTGQQTTTPVIQFNCDGKYVKSITNTGGSNIFVKTSDSVCLYSNQSCKDTIRNKENVKVALQREQNTTIVGGRNYYEFVLSCIDVPHDVIAIATPLSVNTQTPTQVKHTIAQPQLSLEIKAKDGNAVNTVNIGQELRLEMKADGEHRFSPLECIAYKDSPHVEGTGYGFWLKNPKQQQVCSIYDAALTTEKWQPSTMNTGALELTLFAFRFPGQATVYLECKAHVCPNHASETCQTRCVTGSGERRKRRSSGIQYKSKSAPSVQTAVTSFRVVGEVSASSCGGFFTERLLYCVAVVVTKLATARF